MCGICGYTAHCKNDEQVIKAMCDVIAHRGPDGEGRSILNGAVFGHRRLSLIDLEGGGQPMFRSSEKNSPVFILTFNRRKTIMASIKKKALTAG